MSGSVRQRLKNLARESGQVYNDLLQRFVLERFIYRLSVSRHADQFVLKGALLLRVWRVSSMRATRDIDLLGQMSNDRDSIVAIIRDICETKIQDDGLVFDQQ